MAGDDVAITPREHADVIERIRSLERVQAAFGAGQARIEGKVDGLVNTMRDFVSTTKETVRSFGDTTDKVVNIITTEQKEEMVKVNTRIEDHEVTQKKDQKELWEAIADTNKKVGAVTRKIDKVLIRVLIGVAVAVTLPILGYLGDLIIKHVIKGGP
jgi:hypothetical protein